jgi:hypothetical protein
MSCNPARLLLGITDCLNTFFLTYYASVVLLPDATVFLVLPAAFS